MGNELNLFVTSSNKMAEARLVYSN